MKTFRFVIFSFIFIHSASAFEDRGGCDKAQLNAGCEEMIHLDEEGKEQCKDLSSVNIGDPTIAGAHREPTLRKMGKICKMDCVKMLDSDADGKDWDTETFVECPVKKK